MSTRERVPALGAEGWFTEDGPDGPCLLGDRCTVCGGVTFPRAGSFCRNPRCAGTEFERVPLSRRGTIWSYTDAQYAPPSPYVIPGDAHVPFCIAAVELPAEGIVVLGQVVPGVTVTDLRVGQEVELVVETLFADDAADHLGWRWRPIDDDAAADASGAVA